MVTVRHGAGAERPERQWAGDSGMAADEGEAGLSLAGLPTLHFLRMALRRGRWQWGLIALAGLLIGLTLSVVLPSADQAATSVLLAHDPAEQPADAINTDVAMARSWPVAERAIHQLGLRQSVSSFVAAYSVTSVTDRMILITMGAPTIDAAVARANAVARAFLQVRAQELRAELPSVLAVLNGRISVAWQKADLLATETTKISRHAVSRSQRARLKRLKSSTRRADNVLSGLQLAASAYQVATVTEIADSQVVDPAAAITHTHGSISPSARTAALYAGTGLIPGLALGMGFVIVRALLSRRLSRRDDVADALGVPIGLSVGAQRAGGRLTGRPGRAAAGRRDPQHIADYLRRTVWSVRRGSGSTAALAVVAVDDAQVPAWSLTSLATSSAEQGLQVVLADLCRGAPAARQLGLSDPGVHRVIVAGAELTVVVPDPGTIVPVGPLRGSLAAAWEQTAPRLAAAARSADLLLTLVQLEPALGGEHLATWATDAVVMVTAGRSSGAKIRAVGEMIRVSGVPMSPAVLIAADKADESLGAVRAPAALTAPAADSLPAP